MNRDQFIEMKKALYACAGDNREVEDAIHKWFERYVLEFGMSRFVRKPHPESRIDDTRHVRESMYSAIAQELCQAEAGVETLEATGMHDQDERKIRLFVLTEKPLRTLS